MDEQYLESRLSQIATQWTLVKQAHGDAPEAMVAAQRLLLERYSRPIYRYLAASLREADAAEEVFQDFALRFLQGGFRHVSAERGKFRHYLKTALIRMVLDYRRKAFRQARQAALPDLQGPAAEEGSESASFDDSWRQEVLHRTWNALQAYQQATGRPYYAVLHYRAEHPRDSSAQMAAALSEQLRPERPLTETAIRKTLQRAREQFAELLLDDVAASLQAGDLDALEEELAALELLPYCRAAVVRRRQTAALMQGSDGSQGGETAGGS